jgi:hypothetical protein
VIFSNICQDIFPNSPKPLLFSTVKIKDMFEKDADKAEKKRRKKKKSKNKE